jgi:pimeloyl-ACP methyl ester carboxylesterase
MKFRDFGSPDNPSVVLLHGGGLSWWALTPVINGLKDHYHVVAPIIDGHGEDGETTFVSIADSAQKLIRYIDDHCGGHVHALGGLSIGAQIVIEVLSCRKDITTYAILESALVFPMRGITALTVPTYYLFYGLVKKRWFARMQAKYFFIPESMFEQYYQDSLKISRQSLINITISNGNYTLKKDIWDGQATTLIIVGSKELGIMKKSAETLYRVVPNSTLHIAKNMGHGEISLNYPLHYLKLIETLIGRKS